MNQTANLIETLKKYMKAKGMTYKQLAEEMELSEASVKRLFSKQTFSLTRLEEVCRILDIDFYELALMDRQRNRDSTGKLNDEQERALIRNPKLSIFLYFLVNGWSLKQITQEYEYSEAEAYRMLAELEKLGILEHHPGDRIRLRVSKNVYWQGDGPLQQEYDALFINDFMESDFSLPGETLVFSPGQFSKASLRIIQKKIDSLVKEYNELAEMDSSLPIKGRYSTGLLIGFRPWVYSAIANLRRRKITDS